MVPDDLHYERYFANLKRALLSVRRLSTSISLLLSKMRYCMLDVGMEEEPTYQILGSQ